jgi:ABC-type branched-subunit amino acid transport system substrate-binding protein
LNESERLPLCFTETSKQEREVLLTNRSPIARLIIAIGLSIFAVLALSVSSSSGAASAEKQYDPGVSDSEIKIGKTAPFSGPLSPASAGAKVIAKYYEMINSKGGINGRKVIDIQLDDAYNPPKTVEQTRKLVEGEQVFAMIGSTGTPTNAAVQKYLNYNKVPQLFITTGASRFNDPSTFPYTFPLYPSYYMEAKVYAKYLLENVPNARIGVLYQADDFGLDRLKGLKAGLGAAAARMIVSEQTIQVTDPTIDSQIVNLRSSGADVVLNFVTQKATAQTVRKIHELGWKPLHIVNNVAASQKLISVAGSEAAKGVVTGRVIIEASEGGVGAERYIDFMKTWYPDGDPTDSSNVWGYLIAQMSVIALERCGDNLTRENLIEQTAALRDIELNMIVPGIRINYAPNDHSGFHQLQMVQFDGKGWVPFGSLLEDIDTSAPTGR